MATKLRKSSTTEGLNNKVMKSFRFAKLHDVPGVNKLHNPETDFYFGSNRSIEEILDTTISAKTMISETGEIIGFICFNIAPNIPALNNACWVDWIKHKFCIQDCTYNNTFFIEYLVFDPYLDPTSIEQVFIELFLAIQIIELLVVTIPPIDFEKTGYHIYNDLFKSIKGELWTSKLVPLSIPHQKLITFKKSNYLPNYRCRVATPEDNDSIVQMLDKKYPTLKKRYGEFYVAEQILKNDPNRTYIVFEEDDDVLGTMLLNSKVEIDYLNKNYDLSLFRYLKKYGENPVTNTLIVKDVVLKDTKDFLESNYFNIKARMQRRKLETLREIEDDKASNKSIDESSKGSLDEILLSLSFETLPDSAIDDRTESMEAIQDIWNTAGTKILDSNPNYIYKDKIVQIPEGESNIFMIELFANNTQLVDKRRMQDLLKAAYSLFNDKDYCITLVRPKYSNDVLLRYFSYVAPRPKHDSELSLYLSHRNTVSRTITLSEIISDDMMEIESFLKIHDEHRCPDADKILHIIKDSLINYKNDYQCLVIRSVGCIIGIIILCGENRLHLLKKYFYIDSYINYKDGKWPWLHGRILYLLLIPIYNSSYRLIFRQASRLSGYKYFYYEIEDMQEPKLYNNLLGEMNCVLPTLVYDIFDKDCTKHRDGGTSPKFEKLEPFPLYVYTVQDGEIHLSNIDTRIVCIGFDDVCKGFLKKILFDPKYKHYRFQNITVITKPGAFECETSEIYNYICKLLNWSTYFGPDYLRRLGLRVWVEFHAGTIGAINRSNKTIFFHDLTKMHYDYLILTCSELYGYPPNAVWKNAFKPTNYETINGPTDAALFAHKMTILQNTFRKGFEIVIYGNHPKTYACINFLLEQKIPGNCIHFVRTRSEQLEEFAVNALQQDYIKSLLDKVLQQHGVHVYDGYNFISWEFIENSYMIKQIKFASKFNILKLNCKLFISFSKSNLNRIYKKIFQNCGLIIDGRLIINEDFTLNDPYVYAAGQSTQYKRALFAAKFDHCYFNRFEAGESLATKICQKILNLPNENVCKLGVERFSRNRHMQTFLPGGYLLMTIAKAGRLLPPHIASLLTPTKGVWLKWIREEHEKSQPTTSNYDNENEWKSEYFNIQFHSDGTCRSITCLTKMLDKSLDFLIEIFSYHEKLLNNFLTRWKSGERFDPLTFFTKSWTQVLFYPRFGEMQSTNTELIMKILLNDSFTGPLIRKYMKAKTKLYLSVEEKKSIKNVLNKDSIVKKIELNLLNFINENHHFLFMYKKCPIDTSYFLETFKELNKPI